MRLNADSSPYFTDKKAVKEQQKISAELEELAKAQSGEATEEDLDKRPVSFVKGTIVSVDCSVDPGAVLTLRVAGKPLKLRAKSRNKIVMIGGENFDCAWKNVKVSANYRKPQAGAVGDIVSLELE